MMNGSLIKRFLPLPVVLAFVLLISLRGNLSRISDLSGWFWVGMAGLAVCLGLATLWLTPSAMATWSKPKYLLVFGVYTGTFTTLTTALRESLSHSLQWPFAIWMFFAGFIGGTIGAAFRKSRL